MSSLFEGNAMLYILSGLIFLVFLLIFESVYLLWKSSNAGNTIKINRRLRALSAGGIDTKTATSLLHVKNISGIPLLNRYLNRIPRLHAIDRSLEQASIDITVTRFITIQLALIVITFAILTLTLNPGLILSLAFAAIIGISLPWTIVNMKKTKRRDAFTSQLPATLDFIARSLRAGNPFLSAIKAVSKEMPEPTATEFGITFDELNYGVDLEVALHNLGERTGSEEIRFFITAVLIQQKTGGNLADVLNKISGVMRSRFNTYREVKVLAAEMTYSAYVLLCLPFFVAGALMITNPDYLAILFKHELGLVIIGVQILLMTIGYAIVRHMINFRV